ncbi:MAG: cyclase family protein [Candidatus Thermoplasmatota archaeon]|jgi:kynurenine formamidase|nr:cyclase family protein [Candidatus Thermoplasmatota archaeon]
MSVYIDLSHNFEKGMPVPDWPGEHRQDFELDQFNVNVNSGTQNNLRMNLHCGTHVDAPFHYWKEGVPVDMIPMEKMIGKCYTISIKKNPLEGISDKDIEPHVDRIKKGQMLFINTGWYKKWPSKEYETSYPFLFPEAGKLIASLGVSVLGLDTPGPDAPIRSGKRKGDPLHIELLSKGMPVIENLNNLDAISGMETIVYALPIKISGSSGAPARVVALL